MTICLGPYIMEKCFDNGSVQIRTIDEEGIPLLVNATTQNLQEAFVKGRVHKFNKQRGVCDGKIHSFPHLLKKKTEKK